MLHVENWTGRQIRGFFRQHFSGFYELIVNNFLDSVIFSTIYQNV